MSACPECDKARTPLDQLVYTFGFLELDVALSWSLRRAWSIATAQIRRGARPQLWVRADLEAWVREYSDVRPEHLDHLPADVLDTIGLAADVDWHTYADKMPWLKLPADLPRQTILLDGNHRAARALRDRQEFAAYWLEPAELRACLHSVAFGAAVDVLVGRFGRVRRPNQIGE